MHNENAKIEYFSVSKSLRRLIQLKELEISALSKVKFGGKITTIYTRYNSNASFDSLKEIEIWTDGYKQDIYFNGCHFSYLIKGYKNQSWSQGLYHRLTIQGRWNNDEDFCFSFTLSNQMEELISIIYAFIIISETKDIQKADIIWKVVKQEYSIDDVADRLKLIIEGEKFLKNVLNKYPFMVFCIKDGLIFQIEKFKKDISNLKFLQ